MKKNKYEELIAKKLYSKYKINNTLYALNVIDNIIFNERSHIVSTFKDYLILDDEFEFLKRYYNSKESKIRLKNFLNYYAKNKRQIPNYSSLKEAKLILKNIFNKNLMAENLEKSIKQRKVKKNVNSIESLSNTIFNSKVYDSIINDSENCLSIFSYDKDSLCNGNSSRNKNEDSINKLVNHFEELDKEITFSFGNNNNKDKIQKLDFALIKNIDLEENNYQTDRLKNTQKSQNIYKKKKTPNNSINRRKNIIYNSTKTQKDFYIKKNNENVDYINYKNLVLYSENHHNPVKIISNNLNTSPNIPTKGNNSSMPNLDVSPENIVKSKYIKSPSIIINKDFNISTLKSKKIKINNIKIKEHNIKDNLLTERIPKMIKVKINMKKNYIKIDNKNLIRKNNINKNIIKNPEIKYKDIKINKNKISYLKQKAKIDNKSCLYNTNKKNVFKNNLINNNTETNHDYIMKSIEKLDTLRSHSNNNLKDQKINLIKKNINNNINSGYLINKYKNRLSNYNNYTSIQFNNNNINIINSNNPNNNNICRNTYGHYPQKSEDINIFNNISNIGNQTERFKNKRKKLNKKCISSFYNNNTEQINQKFKFKKNLPVFENLDLLNNNNNINENFNTINNFLQHHRGLNSERISTPFNSKQNKKIFFKVYRKVNLSNNKDKKNQTIINDTYKKYKNNFMNKKMINYLNNSNNIDNYDKFNSTHMSTFNKTKKKMNSINFNNSNYTGLNSSIYTKKNNKNENEMTYFNNIDKNDLFKNNFDLNISSINREIKKDKKDLNNVGQMMRSRKLKKENDLLEIKKLDARKNMIINQFNQQMNQIKLKFIKEIENKFEISKRNIMNKRKNKNKLNVNPNFIKFN